MSGTTRGWLGLGLGLAVMAGAVMALHHASAAAGNVMALSQARGLESDAYFYTEAGDVGAFLADEGRYRRPPRHDE